MPTLATEPQVWIQELCRQFSDATGWPLKYTRVDSTEAAETPPGISNDPECCWCAEIHDGQRRIGFLYIDLLDNTDLDRSFLSVCQLAQIIAEQINKLSAAERMLKSRTEEVSTLVDIGRSISNEQDLLAALHQLLRAAVQLTGLRAAGFFLLNPSTNELNLRVSHHLEADQIPYACRKLTHNPPDLEALTQGRVLLERDIWPEQSRWMPEDTSTALCVAVESEAGPIGTLWVFDRRRRAPGDREVHVLESIAAQIGALLERVVLLKESAVGQRLQRDLQVASEYQAADILSALPPEIGFDAAAISTSRYELGGDLCELISLDSDRTVIAVGDASGDSVPAAMVMSAVRGALRTLSMNRVHDVLQTNLLMQRINLVLCRITPAHQFMTLLCGVLNTAEKSFTYTNAGHPAPILFHNRQMTHLQSHGMLLGVLSDATYELSTVEVAENDMLVLFSDGVSEAMSRRRTMFRADGIIGAVENHVSASAQEVMQTIWLNLEEHMTGGSEPDDRTLLVIKMGK